MSKLKEAAQQALEALERTTPMGFNMESDKKFYAAIAALRAALMSVPDGAEQPAEPVAWLFQNEETGLTECVDVQQVEWGFEKNNPRWQKIAPLYTAPQPRRRLTDEEILAIGRELGMKCRLGGNPNIDFDYARAVETAIWSKT
jgi:hypothetical protein